jgi:hypothetical protein
MLIPAIGAVAGAALKPSNPLQGALLGAAAGYTGGQALGLTGVAPAVAPAAAPVASAVTPAASASNALASQIASNQAASYAGGNILNAANAANTANVANLNAMNAAGLSFNGMAPGAANVVNTTPSLLDKAGMYATSAYENPVATNQTFASVNSLLQPDQQMASAPVVPVTARNKLANYDPMAALDPYKPSAIGNSQFSLI